MENVELTMWLMGDGAPDVDMVYEEVNRKLAEDINATVDLNFFTWSDWTTKYRLLLSSGEDYDIVFAATWTNYADEARKGAFYEISEDELKAYAPKTAQYPAYVLDDARVDGQLYGLPANQKVFQTLVYMVRGDLMDKYGIEEIVTLQDFGEYLDAVVRNEENLIPYNAGEGDHWTLGSIFLHYMNYMSVDFATVEKLGAERVVIDFLAQPEVVEFYEMIHEWNERGYWSRNALVNKTQARDAFKAGTSAAALTNLYNANESYLALNQQHPEWDVRVFNAYNRNPVSVSSFMSNGTAINARSRNPERSLMLLDLFKNDPEYNILTNYGIEGEHYTVNNAGELEFVLDSGYPPAQACPWGWNNEEFIVPKKGELPSFYDILAEYETHFAEEPLRGFSFDATSVSDIEAALRDIYDEYGRPRVMGFVDDVADSIRIHREKAAAVGADRYNEEVQRQIDEYLASD
jgi:putative aldouronate transport system substrate-binding protein